MFSRLILDSNTSGAMYLAVPTCGNANRERNRLIIVFESLTIVANGRGMHNIVMHDLNIEVHLGEGGEPLFYLPKQLSFC